MNKNMKPKKPNTLLPKLRTAILTGRLPNPYNNDFGIRWITKEALVDYYKVSQKEIEQCLNKLNLEGIVSKPRHSRNLDGGWSRDIYSILKTNENDGPNPLINKFGGKDLPAFQSRAKNKDKKTSNYLRNTYRQEKIYIEQYNNCAENWDKLGHSKKNNLIDNYIVKSRIICCHFLTNCISLSDSHKERLLRVVSGNPSTSFWVLTNCKLTFQQRKPLIKSTMKQIDLVMDLLEYLTDPHERKYFLQLFVSKIDNLKSTYTMAYMAQMFDLTDDENEIFVNKLLEKPDIKLITHVCSKLKFNEEQELKLAPYLVMGKLTIDLNDNYL
jgi:hypothetical protein